MVDTVHHLEAPEGAGRIDSWIAGELTLSRGQVKALIGAGRVTVDGGSSKASRKLIGGEVVVVNIPPPVPTTLAFEEMDLDIAHEDADVVVVNKPSGLVVHPGRGHAEGTLVHGLLDRMDTSDGGPGHPDRPGIVHRLDMGTSGVMVVAKTRAAYDGLTRQFAAHTVDRRYLALVWGFVKVDEGTVDEPLGRNPRDRVRFAVVKGAKRAVTHFTVLERANFKVRGGQGYVTLMECRLETGRTHQVRIHLSHLGHPVVGDPLYIRPLYKPRTQLPEALRKAIGAVDHQLLHARILGFTHPVNGSRIECECPPPADYQAVLDAVGICIGEPR